MVTEGVYGALDLGESSGRADRVLGSLPDRRRLKESCLLSGERADIGPGIMSGGRSLGDTGGRAAEETLASVLSAALR